MKKFIEANCRTIIKVLIWASVLIIGFIVAHNLATAERGYDAIGGEITIFALPVLWWAKPSLKDIKAGD